MFLKASDARAPFFPDPVRDMGFPLEKPWRGNENTSMMTPIHGHRPRRLKARRGKAIRTRAGLFRDRLASKDKWSIHE
jgi:hypothetical protein